jgi:hypothetical protein
VPLTSVTAGLTWSLPNGRLRDAYYTARKHDLDERVAACWTCLGLARAHRLVVASEANLC